MATTETTQKQAGGRAAGARSAAGTDRSQQSAASNDSAADDQSQGISGELRQLVRDKTYEQLDSQRERATGTLGAVAGAVRQATDTLRESGQTGLAGYVSRAADEIDRWTTRLRDQNIDDTVRDVRAFARRNPAIFFGVAFGAGVLAARFLKSSAPAGSSGYQPSSQWTRPSSSSYAEPPSVTHDAPARARDLPATREGL